MAEKKGISEVKIKAREAIATRIVQSFFCFFESFISVFYLNSE